MSILLTDTRAPRLLVAVFIMLMTSGCVTTGLWEQSNRPNATVKEFVGVLTGPDGRPSAVLVLYRPYESDFGILTPTQRLYAVIPFAPDGRTLVAPYGYAGPERLASRIIAAIGADRPAADCVPLVFGKDADAMLKSPAFRTAFRNVPHSDGPTVGHYWCHRRNVDDLTVYAFGPAANLPARDWADDPFPAEAQFVVVPAVVSRPPGAVATTQRQAAALTPVALAVDAAIPVIAPVYVILWLLRIVPGK